MSGSSPPPDNSYQVEQARIAAEERKAAADKVEKQARKEELAGLRSTARSGASGNVRNYFSSQGLDPEKYSGSIEQQLNNILSGISPEEANPGQAFQNAGQSIWDTLQTGERAKYGNSLNTLFAPEFEMRRVQSNLDDPYLAGIEEEQYSDADSIIRNMLDRGVLTSSGYQSARGDLDRQRSGVKTRLNTIGGDLLEKERVDLRNIANRGRQTAENLRLGQSFDPYSYSTEADTDFSEFLNTLDQSIRGQVPGKLFTTAGLAAIGGAGQGAGNTAFNPDAVAGIKDDDKDEAGTVANPNSIF